MNTFDDSQQVGEFPAREKTDLALTILPIYLVRFKKKVEKV
jgi:hypothetical protein